MSFSPCHEKQKQNKKHNKSKEQKQTRARNAALQGIEDLKDRRKGKLQIT